MTVIPFRAFPSVLNDQDSEKVYDLVFFPHRGLAVAAGEFLSYRLFCPLPDYSEKSKRGKTRSQNTPQIRAAIQFVAVSEVICLFLALLHQPLKFLGPIFFILRLRNSLRLRHNKRGNLMPGNFDEAGEYYT